jgi:glycosyltransferase involved in cell wall biosynthesis
MIEAMACGIPVLALRHGSVSEIIDQGVTGAIRAAFWTGQ